MTRVEVPEQVGGVPPHEQPRTPEQAIQSKE